jgi:hypothetical protein
MSKSVEDVCNEIDRIKPVLMIGAICSAAAFYLALRVGCSPQVCAYFWSQCGTWGAISCGLEMCKRKILERYA